MDADEITLLQDYKSYFQNNVDPITIMNGLRTRGYMDSSHVKRVYDVYRSSFGDRLEVWKEVIKNITNVCSFPSFLGVLDRTGYTDLSLELSVHIRNIKGRLNDVVRLQRGNCRGSNHKFAQELFVSLKINTHNNTFKNPQENLHELSQRFRVRFLSEVDSEKRMMLADKYAASLCAEIDSHTMLYVRKFPTHNLFKELENLIPETSNTHVTEVAFKSRMAIACAIADDTERGDEFLTDARVASYHIGPCVQLDNMLYIQVFNYLCQFENNPTDELRDKIITFAGISLQALEDEDDITRIFWKRMFLLRMVYCLLGISNRCDLIPRCVIRQKYVTKARKLMAEIDKIWDGIESRRRMFYHVARARLHELDSRCVKQGISEAARKRHIEEAIMNIEAALFRLETAIALGEEGNFGETKYVKFYASELKERKFQLMLQKTGEFEREGREHVDSSGNSIYDCGHDSYKNEKKMGGACENTDCTSYQPCSLLSQISSSSDDVYTPNSDNGKQTECRKHSTHSNVHYSLDIRLQKDDVRHYLLVSQQDKFRSSCVQPEEYQQHIECQPENAVQVFHQPGNIERELCPLDTQHLTLRSICQPHSNERQYIFEPESVTNRHINIDVKTEDLRQPESTSNCHDKERHASLSTSSTNQQKTKQYLHSPGDILLTQNIRHFENTLQQDDQYGLRQQEYINHQVTQHDLCQTETTAHHSNQQNVCQQESVQLEHLNKQNTDQSETTTDHQDTKHDLRQTENTAHERVNQHDLRQTDNNTHHQFTE
ncbi:uncharacterized protein LOC117317054 [Pecten maximus]|uniref:uncharacterized protein LOC117317054 n=1 Tax=Pecten maximus TaxID=6579 RepID=UPI001458E2D9|nr:uncharacterized protein LOC117317054 [Pecten maximus]